MGECIVSSIIRCRYPRPPNSRRWRRLCCVDSAGKAQIRRRSKGPERALLPIKIGSVLTALGLGVMLASLPGEAWSSVYEWPTSGIALVSELPNLMPLAPLTTLWVPAGILVVLPLLIVGEV